MTRRSFSSPQGRPPIEFDVDGEVFHAAGTAPGSAMLDAAAAAVSENAAERAKSLGAFLDIVLLPESRDRFHARMRDPENPIDVSTAAQVVGFLIETYSGNGTGGPSGSPPSSSPTGTPSTVGAPPAT